MAEIDTEQSGPPDPQTPPTRPRRSGSLVHIGELAYDIYNIKTSYRSMSGQLQLPTAGPDPTDARIVRVHAPYMLKIVQWEVLTVCPIGTNPTLPHWNTSDDDETLVYKDISMDSPVITTGGNAFTWHCWGEYHYIRTSPTAEYPAGTTPVSIVSAGNFVLTEDDFSEDLLDTSDPGDPPIVPLTGDEVFVVPPLK